MKNKFDNQTGQRSYAFTLIELLVVISIIAVISAMTIPVLKSVFRTKKINTAKIELQMIESALENYKSKYGVYPPGNPTNVLVNQLYYELIGVTNISPVTTPATIPSFQVLDGPYPAIPANDYANTFGGVGGVVNCSKGSGEDVVLAKNFLSNLKSTQITTATNATGEWVPYLATSVGGPDASYHPTYVFSGNPFRYVYPGTNNPNSYDLWVQLSIGSTPGNPKLYLVCNWSSAAQINTPLP